MKITERQLLDYVSPKLINRFGRHASLGKHELSPDVKHFAPKIDGERPVWSIVSLGDVACSYVVHGTGKTPQRALECAGLGGWVEDAEKHVTEVGAVNV